jgi:hypothetical protein
MVYQGTLNGMTRYVPSAVEVLSAEAQASAGVDQGLDLLNRAQSTEPSAIGDRDYLRRAIVQLDATQTVALDARLGDVATAAATALEQLDAAVAAFDAGQPYDAEVQAARDALLRLQSPD